MISYLEESFNVVDVTNSVSDILANTRNETERDKNQNLDMKGFYPSGNLNKKCDKRHKLELIWDKFMSKYFFPFLSSGKELL